MTQHACAVTVAKYSPSGFYIASADKSGKVRIWDTVNAEHILKNEYQVIVPVTGENSVTGEIGSFHRLQNFHR